ncbi:helix-turn-helix domain-containing protein [Gemmobacter nectariphilus]|uniref:helix-turn-helix domain-containing protein n=1 Tax=Gemmobacter nectariphilus TaxID=220343 RepID=UPI00042402CD|nr:helix-turn-helix transcriptional regulator [Gemmobacter nectariphilus]
MSQALRDWVSAERGRAARMADELGLSRPYVSNLVNGSKPGSVDVWRRISEYTGIPASELIGGAETDEPEPQGFSEPQLTAFHPPTGQTAHLRTAVRALFPDAKNPTVLIARGHQPTFGVLDRDLIIYEQKFDHGAIPANGLVIAQILSDAGTARTTIGRLAAPWIIGHDATVRGTDGLDASILGVVLGVLRGTAMTSHIG